MLRVVAGEEAGAELGSVLDEIVREGAQRMLAAALDAEVDAYIAGLADQLDERGHRLVVRNGHAQPRKVQTGAGPLEVEALRVNDRRVEQTSGERCRFRSSILPPWARKSPKVAEVLPLMYLHGMSTKDFAPALTAHERRHCQDPRQPVAHETRRPRPGPAGGDRLPERAGPATMTSLRPSGRPPIPRPGG